MRQRRSEGFRVALGDAQDLGCLGVDLDPRRGDSPTQLAAVAVLAPSGALADALTKPMFMGRADDALALARRWGVDVLTVDRQGRLRASAGVALHA